MIAERLISSLITATIRLLTGAQARWVGCGPSHAQRIYFANHTSHLDFVLVWSALPGVLRKKTRPVAASDYWGKGAMRRYLIVRIFRGVLIARSQFERDENPIDVMRDALDEGASLILFPEGRRGDGESVQNFKAGLYHLAEGRPDLELVPVWIDNSYRAMPKGVPVPIPLLCSVTFGTPVHFAPGSDKPEFLTHMRQRVVELGNS